MYKSAYTIVKNGIEQNQSYRQIIERLKDNVTLEEGCQGDCQLNDQSENVQPCYVKFTTALASLFEKVDLVGWDDRKGDSWKDEKITGSEKITVHYVNDHGWAITIGHTDNGMNLVLKQAIELEGYLESRLEI